MISNVIKTILISTLLSGCLSPVDGPHYDRWMRPNVTVGQIIPPIQGRSTLVVFLEVVVPRTVQVKTLGDVTSYMTFTATGSNMDDFSYTVPSSLWQTGSININFNNLLPGQVTVAVQGANNASNQIFSGSNTTTVLDGQIAQMTITATYKVGTIKVPFNPNQPIPTANATVSI